MNITNETVVPISQNLTVLINQTNDTADRNVDNIQVVTSVLTQIAVLFVSNMSLPLEVIKTVSKLVILLLLTTEY